MGDEGWRGGGGSDEDREMSGAVEQARRTCFVGESKPTPLNTARVRHPSGDCEEFSDRGSV